MRQWIVLAVALFLSGCLAQPPVTATQSYEVPMERPFVEPTATPVCQHFPGVTLETRRISDSAVELHVSGLQPGENPSVIYTTSSDLETLQEEAHNFAKGADEHGEFSLNLLGLTPLGGQTSATWDIRFIHSRGVECATITLP